MNKSDTLRSLAISIVASAIAVPILAMAVRAFFGPVNPGSVITGSLLASAFLGSTVAVSLIFWGAQEFKSVIIRSYLAKVVALAAAGYAGAALELDPPALAAGAVASGVTYLACQIVVVARNR